MPPSVVVARVSPPLASIFASARGRYPAHVGIPLATHILVGLASIASLLLPAILFERVALWLSTIERPDGTTGYSPTLRTAIHLFATLFGIDQLRLAAIQSVVMGAILGKIKSRSSRKPGEVDIMEARVSEEKIMVIQSGEVNNLNDKTKRAPVVPSPLPSISSGPSSTPSTDTSNSPASFASSTSESFCSRDDSLFLPLRPVTPSLPPVPPAPTTPLWPLRPFAEAQITYSPLETIYAASFVHVFSALAHSLDGRTIHVVVKIQRDEYPGMPDLESECFLRVTLSGSPFLVKFRAAWRVEEDAYFVMNPYPETFTNLIRSPSIGHFERRLYAAELLLALDVLHASRVLHGDVKPANILISPSGHLALADFGLSVPGKLNKPASAIRDYGSQGTVGYGAPEEVCEDIAAKKGWGVEADVWSYGVVVAEMFAVKNVNFFQRATREDTEEATLFLPILGIAKYVQDPLALDLVLSILQRDPEERLTLREVKQHRFFTDINWKTVKERRYEHTYRLSTEQIIPQEPQSSVDRL